MKVAKRMGKNLKGKEIGTGISQRKDGLYCARFVNKRGKCQERYFLTLPEARNWLDDAKHTKPVRAADDIKFLTLEEQQIFLDTARRSHNYNQYALILETGLRAGELIGLIWEAIDWEKRTLTANKTLEYRHKQGVGRAGPPKTQHSYHTTHVTNRAYAAQAIEGGMQPKVLQKLLGHTSIKTAMDGYVHVTGDSLPKAIP